jgi:hypothetical protein
LRFHVFQHQESVCEAYLFTSFLSTMGRDAAS